MYKWRHEKPSAGKSFGGEKPSSCEDMDTVSLKQCHTILAVRRVYKHLHMIQQLKPKDFK